MSIHANKLPATPDAAFAQLRESVDAFKTQAGKTLATLKANQPTVDRYAADGGDEAANKFTTAACAQSSLERAITTLNATYGEAALMDPTATAAMMGRNAAIEFASKKSGRARELTELLETVERAASADLVTAGTVNYVSKVIGASAHTQVVLEAADANTEAILRYLEKSGVIAIVDGKPQLAVQGNTDVLGAVNANTKAAVGYLKERLGSDFERGRNG